MSGLVVVNAINPRFIVSNGRRLWDVKISWPLPSSDIIFMSSPSKYSKIPASISSIATVILGSLYTTISIWSIEIIFFIPSDSYLKGSSWLFFSEISWTFCIGPPFLPISTPSSDNLILNPGTISHKTIFILSMALLIRLYISMGIKLGWFSDKGIAPAKPFLSSWYRSCNGISFRLISPELTVSMVNNP